MIQSLAAVQAHEYREAGSGSCPTIYGRCCGGRADDSCRSRGELGCPGAARSAQLAANWGQRLLAATSGASAMGTSWARVFQCIARRRALCRPRSISRGPVAVDRAVAHLDSVARGFEVARKVLAGSPRRCGSRFPPPAATRSAGGERRQPLRLHLGDGHDRAQRAGRRKIEFVMSGCTTRSNNCTSLSRTSSKLGLKNREFDVAKTCSR